MGPLASLGGRQCSTARELGDDEFDWELESTQGSFCGEALDCLKKAIKKVPIGAGNCAHLACQLAEGSGFNPGELPRKKLAIEVIMETAQCKLSYIEPEPTLIQQMVVLGQFGTDDAPLREIVVPNIFTQSPITYASVSSADDDDLPVLSPSPSPSPTPSPFFPVFSPTPTPSPSPVTPFKVPLSEMHESRVYHEYTDRGFAGQNHTQPLWRVITSNRIPQPPTEVLDAMYPSVGGGAIVSCATRVPVKELCVSDTIGKHLPVHVNEHGFWVFIPEEAYTHHFGTKAGIDIAGSTHQLGINPLNLFAEMEKNLELNSRDESGEWFDICNGVEYVRNESEAMAGVETGLYPPDTPFMLVSDLLDHLMKTYLPPLSGMCSVVEELLEKATDGLYQSLGHLHLDSITFLSDLTWLPPRYENDVGEDGMLGHIGAHLGRNISNVLFSRQKANWFVDSGYLYHRVQSGDLDRIINSDDVPRGVDINSTLDAIRKNNLLNFMVDISTSLMEYVGATSPIFFPTNGNCFLNAAQPNASSEDGGFYSGFMRTKVCVPDVGDETGEDEFDYEIEYSCDPILIIDPDTNSSTTLQPVPDMKFGECKDMDMPYIIYSEGLNLPEKEEEAFDGRIYNATCILNIRDGAETNTSISHDDTWVKCQLDASILCSQLGICSAPESGHLTLVLICFLSVILLVFIGILIWQGVKMHRQRSGKANSEPADILDD